MVRGPPKPSRREAFVDLALRYAEDDSHGYSQKPPSGRWGPDNARSEYTRRAGLISRILEECDERIRWY